MTMAIVQGMSTLARDGAGQKALLDLARTAMSAWPTGQSLINASQRDEEPCELNTAVDVINFRLCDMQD